MERVISLSLNIFDKIKSVFVAMLPLFRSKELREQSAVTRHKNNTYFNLIAGLLVMLLAMSCLATYGAFREMPPFGDDADTIIWLLTLDLILLLSLVVMLSGKIVLIWAGRKKGLVGAHLHVRLVYIFCVMAAVPTIIMTVFSVYFFHYGIQTWFSDQVRIAVFESQEVAAAYLEEHKQVIRADTLAMANDIDRQAYVLSGNKDALERILQTQSIIRNLSEALILDGNGRVIARSGITFTLEFEELPENAMRIANEGEVAIMTGEQDDRVRALIKLNNFVDVYLFVGRMVDPRVLSHLAATQAASNDYTALQTRSTRLQILVTMIFCILGLLLMFAAIWLGLMLAKQLVMPISDIVNAADRVREGDFTTQIESRGQIDEFDYLAAAFNRMTAQIASQQRSLLDVNQQLDRRRQFTETVLAGATAGILGVDRQGKVTLANASSARLLGMDEQRLIGLHVKALSEQVADLLNAAHAKPSTIVEAEITIETKKHVQRLFMIRIAVELIEDKDVGAIITFDDITDLQIAQRKAAWSDVARRIAHEIKNPLTPIQLAAERLKRKYLHQITSEADTFAQCTDTIIRHVEDIEHMVNEFSAFARMPDPQLKTQSLCPIIDDVINLHKTAHSDIDWRYEGKTGQEDHVNIDAKQVRQALNNLLQNALDSVTEHHDKAARDNDAKPWIAIDIYPTADKANIIVLIRDNGLGLPQSKSVHHLTEPYVTHKEKGTGLGLAIVKKIMEDHNGDLLLSIQSDKTTIPDEAISAYDDEKASIALVFPLVTHG